jgi:aspartyl aminopeptidase
MSNEFAKKYEYAWDKYTKEDMKKLFDLSERYKGFMSKCKTERECVFEFIKRAEKAGYRNLEDIIETKGNTKSW